MTEHQTNAAVFAVKARKAVEEFERLVHEKKSAEEAAHRAIVTAYRFGNTPQGIANETGYPVERVRAAIFQDVEEN